MDVDELLNKSEALKGSDLHLTAGLPPMVRVNGSIRPLEGYPRMLPDDTRRVAEQMVPTAMHGELDESGQVDFAYVTPAAGRFRVNVYRQRGSYCVAARVLARQAPTIDALRLPETLKKLAMLQRGMVLVCGPTGCGKSTTLAAIIHHISENRRCHVLTIEDPIEYLYRHGNSIIDQREIGGDTRSFPEALRAALREDPDVILVGEMRDLETMATAITAAETGHLVFSTLHTVGAAQAVDRMVDAFPPHQQQQIRVQLSSVLQAVITQQLLLNAAHDGRVAAMEIMLCNDAVRNMIRENKCHQIATAMQTGIRQGMLPMDYTLARMVKQGRVEFQTAEEHCMDRETFGRYMEAVAL